MQTANRVVTNIPSYEIVWGGGQPLDKPTNLQTDQPTEKTSNRQTIYNTEQPRDRPTKRQNNQQSIRNINSQIKSCSINYKTREQIYNN